jgi:rubrerythrin
MSNNQVWIVVYVCAPSEALDHERGFEEIAAVFSSVKEAKMYAAHQFWVTKVVGPLVVQQPKAAEIQAKIEQLQRALVKQVEKELRHE